MFRKLLSIADPGWFVEVFDVEINVSSDKSIETHSMLFHDTCPLFHSNQAISGHVSIKPKTNTPVWHGGIQVTLLNSICFYESLTTTERAVASVKIAEPDYISEKSSFPFKITSEQCSDLVESYEGEMLSARYLVVVTISRPWYTFDASVSTPIVIHKILEEIPNDTITNDDRTSSSPNVMNLLRIKDIDQGACLTYQKSCLVLGEELVGSICLGDKLDESVEDELSVAACQLTFYRIESGETDANEVILLCKEVDFESMTLVDSAVLTGQEYSENTTDDLAEVKPQTSYQTITEAITIPFHLALAPAEASIHVGSTIVDAEFSIRYYLRLVVLNSNNETRWNTHEIVLYRGEVTIATM